MDEEEYNLQTKEKIVRQIRDIIIQANTTIRKQFEITSESADLQLEPYYMRQRIKQVCGPDSSYEEIANFVENIQMYCEQKIKLQSIMEVEVGQ